MYRAHTAHWGNSLCSPVASLKGLSACKLLLCPHGASSGTVNSAQAGHPLPSTCGWKFQFAHVQNLSTTLRDAGEAETARSEPAFLTLPQYCPTFSSGRLKPRWMRR